MTSCPVSIATGSADLRDAVQGGGACPRHQLWLQQEDPAAPAPQHQGTTLEVLLWDSGVRGLGEWGCRWRWRRKVSAIAGVPSKGQTHGVTHLWGYFWPRTHHNILCSKISNTFSLPCQKWLKVISIALCIETFLVWTTKPLVRAE